MPALLPCQGDGWWVWAVWGCHGQFPQCPTSLAVPSTASLPSPELGQGLFSEETFSLSRPWAL